MDGGECDGKHGRRQFRRDETAATIGAGFAVIDNLKIIITRRVVARTFRRVLP